MNEAFLKIGFNILVITIVVVLAMLTYSIRSNKAEFKFGCWLKSNRDRFLGGGILTVGLSTLMVISPDISALLQLLGFQSDKTPIALGLAIATILIGGVSGNPVKPEKKINIDDNL